MKARIKETGEVLIVEEISDKHVYVKMPCSIGMSVALRKEEVEILQDGCNVIDWEQRKYEIAKDVMTGFVIESTFWSVKQIADEAVKYADALIERLGGDVKMQQSKQND